MVFTVWCVCNWLARTKVWPRLPPSDTSGMNCQPGLVTQHQWLTSVKLLWLNGSKSPQSGSQIMWKAWNQKSGGRLMSNNHVFVLVSVYFWLGSALRMNLLLEFKGKEMISLWLRSDSAAVLKDAIFAVSVLSPPVPCTLQKVAAPCSTCCTTKPTSGQNWYSEVCWGHEANSYCSWLDCGDAEYVYFLKFAEKYSVIRNPASFIYLSMRHKLIIRVINDVGLPEKGLSVVKHINLWVYFH